MANGYDQNEGSGGGGFMMGLLAGTVLGAGLGMLLAPKAGAELRDQLSEQARSVGSMASDKVRKASEAAGDWAKSGREVVNSARDAMSRGAEEARGYADTTGSQFSGGTAGQFGGGPKPAGDSGRP